MDVIVFYFFSAIMVIAAFMMITVRNPVSAAFFLVLTFFASAAIWLLMEAEFLAIVLVLVYVGAVMVLFIFVVMMLDINIAVLKKGFVRNLPLAAGTALAMFLMIYLIVGGYRFDKFAFEAPQRHAADYSNTEALGTLLYTDYIYPFEIAAVILLVGIIAAIALTLRRRPNTRHQNIDKQVSVKSSDRLRIVKVESQEKK